MRALGPAPARPALRLAPAALVAALALTGCGGDDSSTSTASDPTASAPTSPTTVSPSTSASVDPTATGSAPADDEGNATTQVAIVSQTAAGGEVYPAATALSDDAAVQAFGAQFTTPRLAARITRVVARTDVPAGSTLYGAVVAIGCDVPAAVVVSTDDGGGVLVEPEPAKPSGVQCLAPVTSVALVLVAGG